MLTLQISLSFALVAKYTQYTDDIRFKKKLMYKLSVQFEQY